MVVRPPERSEQDEVVAADDGSWGGHAAAQPGVATQPLPHERAQLRVVVTDQPAGHDHTALVDELDGVAHGEAPLDADHAHRQQRGLPLHHRLDGTVVDFYDGLEKRGFVFNNPNVTKSCGCGSSFQV